MRYSRLSSYRTSAPTHEPPGSPDPTVDKPITPRFCPAHASPAFTAGTCTAKSTKCVLLLKVAVVLVIEVEPKIGRASCRERASMTRAKVTLLARRRRRQLTDTETCWR